MTHLMKVYFHMCWYLFTAYLKKNAFVWNEFYQTQGFYMFSNIYLNIY